MATKILNIMITDRVSIYRVNTPDSISYNVNYVTNKNKFFVRSRIKGVDIFGLKYINLDGEMSLKHFTELLEDKVFIYDKRRRVTRIYNHDKLVSIANKCISDYLNDTDSRLRVSNINVVGLDIDIKNNLVEFICTSNYWIPRHLKFDINVLNEIFYVKLLKKYIKSYDKNITDIRLKVYETYKDNKVNIHDSVLTCKTNTGKIIYTYNILTPADKIFVWSE